MSYIFDDYYLKLSVIELYHIQDSGVYTGVEIKVHEVSS